MDVERQGLEEGLTHHPFLGCSVYALADDQFEVREGAFDLPPLAVTSLLDPFLIWHGDPLCGRTASGHAAVGLRHGAGQEPDHEGDIVLYGVLPVLHPVIGGIDVDLADAVTDAECQLSEEREGDGVAELLLRKNPRYDLVGVDVDEALQLEPAPVLGADLLVGHAPKRCLEEVQSGGVDGAPPDAFGDVDPDVSGYYAGVLGRSPEDPRPGELGRTFVEHGVVWERIPVARQESGCDTCRLPEIEVEVAHYEGDPEHHRIGVSEGVRPFPGSFRTAPLRIPAGMRGRRGPCPSRTTPCCSP